MKFLSKKSIVTSVTVLMILIGSFVGVGFGLGFFDSSEETHRYSGENLCDFKDNEEYNEISESRWEQFNDPSSKYSSDSSPQAFLYRYPQIFEAHACISHRVVISHNASIFNSLSDRVKEDPGDASVVDPAVAFIEDLNVAGLTNLWGLSLKYSVENDDLDDEDLTKLQSSLSEILAFSTNPQGNSTDKISEEFIGEFSDFAFTEITLIKYKGPTFLVHYPKPPRQWYRSDDDWEIDSVGPTVYGWSVLAPLLREGEFHEDFLTPVATAAVEFDQEQDGDWRIEGEEELSFDMFDDDVTSSIDAVLEALSKNEVAAEEVYAATGDERVGELIS